MDVFENLVKVGENKMIDLRQGDCITIMNTMDDNSVDFTLTDIPYDVLNRESNGLRNLNKDNADVLLLICIIS